MAAPKFSKFTRPDVARSGRITDYYDHDRVILFQLRGYDDIARFYTDIRQFNSASAVTEEQLDRIMDAFSRLDRRLRDGALGKDFNFLFVPDAESPVPKAFAEYRRARDHKEVNATTPAA